MNAWILFPFFVAEVAALAWLDRRWFGTWLTPATLLGVPFVVNVLLCLAVAPWLGFVTLHPGAIAVAMAGIPVLWLGGVGVALSYGKRLRATAGDRRTFTFEGSSEQLALALAWLSIPVVALHFRSSMASVGGLRGLGTDEFATVFSSGVAAHLMALGSALFVFFVGTAERGKRWVIVTAVALGAIILVRQVKYAVLLPITAGVMYRVLSGRMRVTARGVGLFVLGGFLLFAAAYLIGFWAINPDLIRRAGTYQFVVQHFLFYAQAGVLTLGELMRRGVETVAGDPRVTFSPFYNLWAAVTDGQLVGAGDEFAAPILLGSAQAPNVTTMFGPLLIGLGTWGAIIYTFVLGVLAYVVFAVATLSRNAWAVALWAMIAAMLIFGWWCLWFELLAAIEIPAICLVLASAFWLAHNIERREVGVASPVDA